MTDEFAKLGELIVQAIREAKETSWPLTMELTNYKRTIELIDRVGRQVGKIDLPKVLL